MIFLEKAGIKVESVRAIIRDVDEISCQTDMNTKVSKPFRKTNSFTIIVDIIMNLRNNL